MTPQEKQEFDSLSQKVAELEKKTQSKITREELRVFISDYLQGITGKVRILSGELEVPFIRLTDSVSTPQTVSNRAVIYVDSADGDLKVKFGDGFTAVIKADS